MDLRVQKDLSEIHGLISDMFTWPTSEKEWEQYKLTQQQIDFFNTEGYLAGCQILTASQVEILNEELAQIANPNHPKNKFFYEFHSNESEDVDKVLFHALGAWRITPGFHDVVWNPSFVMKASQLLGGDIRFWHDQLFCKPAKHGGVVAWHQDYSYWTRTGPMQHLTCWTGLDDATTENGCLQYVPKSHTWNLLNNPNLAGNMDGLLTYLTAAQKEAFKPIPIKLKKGQCSFHHPLMVHGSYENSSENSRRAFVLNVFKEGTISNVDDELLTGVPVIKKGQKMEGQFFPKLSKNIQL